MTDRAAAALVLAGASLLALVGCDALIDLKAPGVRGDAGENPATVDANEDAGAIDEAGATPPGHDAALILDATTDAPSIAETGASDVPSESGPSATAGCGVLGLTPIPIAPGSTQGMTSYGPSLTSVHGSAGACTQGAGAGPEAVYAYSLDHPADLDIAVTSPLTPADLIFYVRTTCDGIDSNGQPIADTLCAGVASSVANATSIVLQNAQPGTYYVIVDGVSANDVDPFTIDLADVAVAHAGAPCDPQGLSSRCVDPGTYCDPARSVCSRETSCSNLVDDDQDGLTDCQDPTDCQGSPACQPGTTPIGGPCTANTDCAATNLAPACLDETSQHFPGGFCTQWCSLAGDDCPLGSACVAYGATATGSGFCFPSCSTPADCAPGYTCMNSGGRSGVPVCSPDCTANAECSTTHACNLDTGLCTTTPEICTNGRDDDGDLRPDCADLDCAGACASEIAGACASLMDATNTSIVVGPGSPVPTFTGSCTRYDEVPGMGGNAWSYTPPGTGQGALFLHGVPAPPSFLYARSNCADATTELGCHATFLDLPATGGVPVYLFEDAASAGLLSPVTIGFAATTEVEPNDDVAHATVYAAGFTAGITPGDVDFVQFTLPAGQTSVTITTQDFGDGACAGGAIDTALTLYGADGTTALGDNDDIDGSAGNYCSQIVMGGLVPAVYYAKVQASRHQSDRYQTAYGLLITTD